MGLSPPTLYASVISADSGAVGVHSSATSTEEFRVMCLDGLELAPEKPSVEGGLIELD
jgi:hypothetical protein